MLSSAYGGALKYASGAGSERATFTFTGDEVAWVARTGPKQGQAEVWVDGTKAKTVDLYSPTVVSRPVVFSEPWLARAAIRWRSGLWARKTPLRAASGWTLTPSWSTLIRLVRTFAGGASVLGRAARDLSRRCEAVAVRRHRRLMVISGVLQAPSFGRPHQKCVGRPMCATIEPPRLVRVKSRTGLPKVLMYHSISDPTDAHDALCTSPERFEAQMSYLGRRGLRGVSVRELRRAMYAGDARGMVGLTFDDGYEDFLDSALPMLERLGFSATVFVVAGMLGGENTWDHRGLPRVRLRLAGAEGVREISERGMEVGSHTITHPRLSGLDEEALVHEVDQSRQMLTELVGTSIDGLCYPYGNLDGRAVRAVRRAGYAYAVGTKRSISYGVYDWPRVYVGEKDSPLRLGMKLRANSSITLAKRSRQRLAGKDRKGSGR